NGMGNIARGYRLCKAFSGKISVHPTLQARSLWSIAQRAQLLLNLGITWAKPQGFVKLNLRFRRAAFLQQGGAQAGMSFRSGRFQLERFFKLNYGLISLTHPGQAEAEIVVSLCVARVQF